MLLKLLGLLLLGGGVIAGLTLVSQPQLLQEKAADVNYLTPRPTPVPSGYVKCGGQYCAPYNCHCVDGPACTQVACLTRTPTSTPTRTPTPMRTRTPTIRPSPAPTVRSGYVNCGGTNCREQDCHCQGGDPCTGYRCEPNIRTSCLNQGRSWCKNMYGQAYTCCVEGYACNTNGYGCVKQ